MQERWLGSATLAVLAACGFETGGIGSGSASVGSHGGDDAGSETASNESASASAGSSDATDATSPTDPSDSVDSTVTAVDSGDATSSSSATTDDDGTTTSGGAMVHHLMPTTQSACNEPLWCFVGDVWNEYGDPTYGQQCFTSPVAPPFELISVHYIVADVAPELTGFQLEVHSRDESGPTDTIAFEQKTAADATPGNHEHVFATPVQIVDSQFCVGFAAPSLGLAGALGMAVDIGTSVSDVSFIRLEGPTGCAIPLWSDVIDDRDPIPSGNWCIDVQIREIP